MFCSSFQCLCGVFDIIFSRFSLIPAMHSGKIYILPSFLLWSIKLKNCLYWFWGRCFWSLGEYIKKSGNHILVTKMSAWRHFFIDFRHVIGISMHAVDDISY